MREPSERAGKGLLEGEWLSTVLERVRGARYPLLVVLLGVLLLAWPSSAPPQEESKGVDRTPAAVCDLDALEQRLARSLSRVEGVGEAEVVLTISSLGQEVLAQDESRQGEEWNRTTVVLQGGDRQETTVTTQVLGPTFQGALVVCEGGGSAAVQLEVKRAVAALTGLGMDRITVCEREGGRKR